MLLAAGGSVANTIAQNKMNKELSNANKLAWKAAEEQKKEIKEQKTIAAAERKSLIDDQRVQLGAGLALDDIVGTRAKNAGIQPVANMLG
jgi:sialic acid synthase SpsE